MEGENLENKDEEKIAEPVTPEESHLVPGEPEPIEGDNRRFVAHPKEESRFVADSEGVEEYDEPGVPEKQEDGGLYVAEPLDFPTESEIDEEVEKIEKEKSEKTKEALGWLEKEDKKEEKKKEKKKVKKSLKKTVKKLKKKVKNLKEKAKGKKKKGK